tara:strand:- start:284 stop:1210 length:927 start_codon:yes stop_codon:yes gene_type:complete
MEIVITGASGLLGKNLIKYLCNFPYKIYGFGRENSYDFKSPNFNYIQIDWDKYDEIIELISRKNIDFFIHLAGIQAKKCEEDFKECYEFNINKTFMLAKDCQQYKVKNFLFSSSFQVYKDSDYKNVLKDVNNNNSNYSNSKIILEYLLSSLSKSGITNFQIIRISNIIGPLMSSYKNKDLLFINDICYQAIVKNQIRLISNPLISRDFIPVSLFCKNINEIIKKNNKNFSISNVKSNLNLNLYQMANLVKEQFQKLFDKEIKIHYENEYQISKDILNKSTYEKNMKLILEIKSEISKILNEINLKYYD